ncbi:MAG: 6-bladed beta-propeller [Gracilimonas sp.]|nr:6-bladed beta-propeller [Gracilimonas sp.]
MLTVNNIKLYLILFISCFYCSCEKVSKESIPDFFSGYSDISNLKLSGEPISTVEFAEEQSFADFDSVFYREIKHIGVDFSSRVYLNNEEAIHVYEKDGSYLRKIGRKGRGPGKFEAIHNFIIKNNRLYVYDAFMTRISVFNLNSFKLENEISLPSLKGLVGLGEFAVKNEGSLVLGMTESRKKSNSVITEKYMHYYHIDNKGVINDSRIETNKLADYFKVTNANGSSYPPIPFDRTTIFSLSESGKMYFAWTGEIAIKIFDANGRYMKGIYCPFENEQVRNDSDYPEAYKVLNITSDMKRVLGIGYLRLTPQ